MACQPNPQVDYVLISGQINSAEQLQISPDYGFKGSDKTISLNADGSFQDTLFGHHGLHTLFDGKQPIELYFQPGKIYNLEYDAKTFQENGLRLTGNDTTINAYYIEKLRNRVFINPLGDGKSESEFLTYLQEIQQDGQDRLDAAQLPNDLRMYEQQQLDFQLGIDLLFYLYYAEIDTPNSTSQAALDFDYANETLYQTHGTYKRLVQEHYSVALQKSAKQKVLQDSTYDYHEMAVREYATIIPSERILNDILEDNALYHLKYALRPSLFYKDFQQYYTGGDSTTISKVNDLYLRLTSLKPGTPSPQFSNFTNYDGGTTSLEDFMGQYVFIDLWASWCGNCLVQVPALKELEAQYQDANIQFISIAWKDQELNWRQAIEEKGLTGIHLFPSRDDYSFFEEYGVYGIPRYMLIDPAGKIVDHNTPRPKDKGLVKLFEGVGL
ncbi:MAG: TlpA disulfide reductase family protein [Bacteroidota bacterium]